MDTTDADAAAELTMESASGAITNALHAGARAPLFILPDKEGNKIALDQLLRAGPVVLNFLRGAWCSFGEESLARFCTLHERIVAAGATAVAIAPPDIPARKAIQLSIRELVDAELRVSRSFGLTFDLPEALRDRYLDLGYMPPKSRKHGDFLVPVPATYLIDGEGVVVFASVDFDYRKEFDSESLLKAVRALRARRDVRRRVIDVRHQLKRA
jgi:peroxiredoxin